MNLLGDLRDLFSKPSPVYNPVNPRMTYERILSASQPGGFLDAPFPVQQAIFYNPTPAILQINRTPVTPTSEAYDYSILPYSMFILERFTERQVAVSLIGALADNDKALVSLLHGYADFVRFARSITPVTPPMPRPIIGVYIIDTNGDFVLSSGGEFVIEA